MKSLSALLAAFLIGCATPEPRVITNTVRVPVPVACIKGSLPTRPALMTDPQLATLDDFALVTEIEAERVQFVTYAGQLEALLSACR